MKRFIVGLMYEVYFIAMHEVVFGVMRLCCGPGGAVTQQRRLRFFIRTIKDSPRAIFDVITDTCVATRYGLIGAALVQRGREIEREKAEQG